MENAKQQPSCIVSIRAADGIARKWVEVSELTGDVKRYASAQTPRIRWHSKRWLMDRCRCASRLNSRDGRMTASQLLREFEFPLAWDGPFPLSLSEDASPVRVNVATRVCAGDLQRHCCR